MSIFDEPKIDCHCHILHPSKFPYIENTPFRPAGHEVATEKQYRYVMKAYGVRYALWTQPNSGYFHDNSAMLDAIANGGDRYKGIGIFPHDASRDMLLDFKSSGVLGAAFNTSFAGVDFYKDARGLIERLADLDMFIQFQFEKEELLPFMPWLEDIPVKILIDHCGRPVPEAGLNQPNFQAVLRLGRTGRAAVKLSGYPKMSRVAYPFEDMHPYVHALLDTFTPQNTLWASDWPFLRAPERQDYGPLLALAGELMPDPAVRKAVFWDTPRRLFGFGQ